MKIPSFSEIQAELSTAATDSLPTLDIRILRNVVVEPIEPYLRYFGLKSGLNVKVQFGEFDNVFQEAVGAAGGILSGQVDVVLVMLQFESLSSAIALAFAQHDAAQIQQEIERIEQQVEAIVTGIRRQTAAMILWHSFEYVLHPSLGIVDAQSDSGQNATIKKLNDSLRQILTGVANAYLIDINLPVACVGAANFYDQRFWHIGRAPYTREALREIATENFKFIRPLKGLNKKCLILDCDETLWGGIVGEDGIAGIRLGKSYPGSPYLEFQREIVNLYNRGIIIALCSKNNEDDVWEVFRNHPEMILKEHHIAAAKINWRDKAENIRQLALDLNIGTNSLVFMDDSNFEIELIRKELPEVEAIHLPKEQPYTYRQILASCGLFDTLTITEEDRARGQMYRAESQRQQMAAQITDMASYHKSLEMVLHIKRADDFSIPRIAQLTQKTNQFNLTTRRYSDAEIKAFATGPESAVFYIKLEDRFGDSGIVGVCIVKFDGKVAYFDSYLLSCRILGRGVEDTFLRRVLKLAKKRGCSRAIGEYYATRKNAQVADFYGRNEFVEVNRPDRNATKVFEFDLAAEIDCRDGHFKQVISDID